MQLAPWPPCLGCNGAAPLPLPVPRVVCPVLECSVLSQAVTPLSVGQAERHVHNKRVQLRLDVIVLRCVWYRCCCELLLLLLLLLQLLEAVADAVAVGAGAEGEGVVDQGVE